MFGLDDELLPKFRFESPVQIALASARRLAFSELSLEVRAKDLLHGVSEVLAIRQVNSLEACGFDPNRVMR